VGAAEISFEDQTPKDIAVDMDEDERAESIVIERVLPWAARHVLTAGREPR
jgi:hypothetical protein